MHKSLALFALLAATPALAAPPPGHPTPAQTRDLLLSDKPVTAADLPNVGKVVSTIDANEFTYIEVDRGGRSEWIAAPKMSIPAGSTIRFEEGAVMNDFYSKLLKRTFPSVMFVNDVIVTSPSK